MNELRLITEGIGAWLHYEFCSNRSRLFSEKYLAPPIGTILSSIQPDGVHAEFEHQVLSSTMKGPGRRPAIDFVVSSSYPTPRVAIESKWIGKSAPQVHEVMRDLIRLSLLCSKFNTTCYFVLAGRRRRLEEYFCLPEFAGPQTARGKPILSTVSNRQHAVSLTPDPSYRVALLKKCFARFSDIQVPQRIISRRTEPFPHNAKSVEYQVYGWQILVPKSNPLFWPKRSKHFK